MSAAIYWNNHHHMMQSARKVTGSVLWANYALPFFLTLFPLMIRWIDGAGNTTLPSACLGLLLVGAAISDQLLERPPNRAEGEASVIKRAIGGGAKDRVSFALYTAAVPGAFLCPWISVAIFGVSILWVVPDRGFEGEWFERKQS